jgi:hypothetical protein
MRLMIYLFQWTSGAGTVYTSGANELVPGFSAVRVIRLVQLHACLQVYSSVLWCRPLRLSVKIMFYSFLLAPAWYVVHAVCVLLVFIYV